MIKVASTHFADRKSPEAALRVMRQAVLAPPRTPRSRKTPPYARSMHSYGVSSHPSTSSRSNVRFKDDGPVKHAKRTLIVQCGVNLRLARPRCSRISRGVVHHGLRKQRWVNATVRPAADAVCRSLASCTGWGEACQRTRYSESHSLRGTVRLVRIRAITEIAYLPSRISSAGHQTKSLAAKKWCTHRLYTEEILASVPRCSHKSWPFEGLVAPFPCNTPSDATSRTPSL